MRQSKLSLFKQKVVILFNRTKSQTDIHPYELFVKKRMEKVLEGSSRVYVEGNNCIIGGVWLWENIN